MCRLELGPAGSPVDDSEDDDEPPLVSLDDDASPVVVVPSSLVVDVLALAVALADALVLASLVLASVPAPVEQASVAHGSSVSAAPSPPRHAANTSNDDATKLRIDKR